jgi:DNA-binding FadR family transcriptional regulator
MPPTKGAALSGPKLAIVTANEIERRIAKSGWPIGQMIGSEADLMAEFGVSRAVLREAMLLLEARQVAAPRRGPGGGLVVRGPEASSVAEAAARLLEYEGVTADHLSQARLAIEQLAAEFAIRELNEVSIRRLREHVALRPVDSRDQKLARLRSFHGLLAELSGNPVFKLMVAVLVIIAQDFIQLHRIEVRDDEIEESLGKQALVAEAVCEGDAALARARIRDYIGWVSRYAGPPAGKRS